MLRILVADDQAMLRRGVRRVIESHEGWEVCGEAADGEAALAMALRERPDIAVLNVSLSTLGGIVLTRRLSQESPATQVLLFVKPNDDEAVRQAMAAGARGCLLETDGALHLEAAIRALDARRTYLSSVLAERFLGASGVNGQMVASASLSKA